jgi:hypothetical protein
MIIHWSEDAERPQRLFNGSGVKMIRPMEEARIQQVVNYKADKSKEFRKRPALGVDQIGVE